MIKIITNLEELQKFRDNWNFIYTNTPNSTPFQHFEYLYSSLININKADDNLYIIILWNNIYKQWFAVFPFIKTKKGILKFINVSHSDFCTPLIIPQFNNYNLYEEVAEFLSAQKDIKGLWLENVRPEDSSLSMFKPFFKYSVSYDMNYFSDISIYSTENDRDIIDAFRYVNSTKRKNLRKLMKSMEGIEFKLCNKSDNIPYPAYEINFLIKFMVEKGIRDEEYFSDSMLTFWKDLYENGVLSVALLGDGENIKSCNLIFYNEKRNEYISWIMLYTDRAWNLNINLKIAEYIYNNGMGTINFARGIYDYKLVNFHPDVKPLFCVKIAKTKWGHCKNIVSMASHFSKPIIKTFLRR